MKLLIYSHFFVPSVGGVETSVLALARGLTERGLLHHLPEFQITVVTKTPAGNFDDRTLPFQVVRQPSLFKLARLILDADLLHTAGPTIVPLMIAQLFRKPTVIEHHGYQAICPNGLLLREPERSLCVGHFQRREYWECLRCRAAETSWIRSLVQMILMIPRSLLSRGASRNIAISDHVLQRHRLPRTQRIYYGIEDLLLKQPALEKRLAPQEFCFAYLGRFFPEKGILVLVEAANILRREGFRFEVRLIGDGPQRQEIEEKIAEKDLQDTVKITGYLTGSAMTDALRDVLVIVMPSVCEETAGLSAIEQMMRGRTVIASEIGGLGEVVGDAGVLCSAGDPLELADSMRTLLINPSLLESIGEKARERALSLFRRSRMIEEHARLYHELVGTG